MGPPPRFGGEWQLMKSSLAAFALPRQTLDSSPSTHCVAFSALLRNPVLHSSFCLPPHPPQIPSRRQHTPCSGPSSCWGRRLQHHLPTADPARPLFPARHSCPFQPPLFHRLLQPCQLPPAFPPRQPPLSAASPQRLVPRLKYNSSPFSQEKLPTSSARRRFPRLLKINKYTSGALTKFGLPPTTQHCVPRRKPHDAAFWADFSRVSFSPSAARDGTGRDATRGPTAPTRPPRGLLRRVAFPWRQAAVQSARHPISRCWEGEGGNGGGAARPCHPPGGLRGARRENVRERESWYGQIFFIPEDPLLPHTQALGMACEKAQPWGLPQCPSFQASSFPHPRVGWQWQLAFSKGSLVFPRRFSRPCGKHADAFPGPAVESSTRNGKYWSTCKPVGHQGEGLLPVS